MLNLWKNDRFVGTVNNTKELADFMFLSNYAILDVIENGQQSRAYYSRYHGKLTLSQLAYS